MNEFTAILWLGLFALVVVGLAFAHKRRRGPPS